MCGAKPLRLARHKKSTPLKFTKSGTSRKSNHRETPLLRIPAPAAIVGGASSRRFYALCYSERRRSCASLRPRQLWEARPRDDFMPCAIRRDAAPAHPCARGIPFILNIKKDQPSGGRGLVLKSLRIGRGAIYLVA